MTTKGITVPPSETIFIGFLVFLGVTVSIGLCFSLYGVEELMKNSTEGFYVSVSLIRLILLIIWIINDFYQLNKKINIRDAQKDIMTRDAHSVPLDS